MIKEKFILPIGLLFFLCAAFFSKGYFHADEHFQLLEFANYALENQENPIWEYQEKIRPSGSGMDDNFDCKIVQVFRYCKPNLISL